VRETNRLSDATWTAFTQALMYIVIPIVLMNLVTTRFPDLTTAFTSNIKTYIVFIGGMITASSALEAINRPGTYKRMLFGMTALAFICMWLFVIFGGGIVEYTYQAFIVRFDMSKIVYIMLFGISLKALLVYSTFSGGRDYVVEQKRRERLERLKTTRRGSAPRPQKSSRRRPAMPSFSDMSKVDFHVTPDDSVGFAPPPPPPQKPVQRTLAYKECQICGARASPKETTCKNCGAWFPKDTIR
jgi:hypothetical protein